MREVGLGDSWLAIETDDASVVAKTLAGDARLVRGTLRTHLDGALEGRVTVVLSRRGVDGERAAPFVLVAPAFIDAEDLVRLSARLATRVYAFEANDDHGLRIALAERGTLVRDLYFAPSAGESRDVGERLDDEPDELTSESVLQFAEDHAGGAGASPDADVVAFAGRWAK